jgi:hypothetical protein
MYSSTLSSTSALSVGGWSTPRPGRITPWEETRYPLYRRLGGPQGRSGRVRKTSPSPGFDPRTVQPVASRYTDWAIPARHVYWCKLNSTSGLMTNDLMLPINVRFYRTTIGSINKFSITNFIPVSDEYYWCGCTVGKARSANRNLHKRNGRIITHISLVGFITRNRTEKLR